MSQSEFSDFLINNLRQNLEPEDIQILKNNQNSGNNNMCCKTIQEEEGPLKSLPQTSKNQQIEFARRWAENVNNYCLDNVLIENYNNVILENDCKPAHNTSSFEDDYNEEDSSSQQRNLSKTNTSFKELRCSFNKIDRLDGSFNTKVNQLYDGEECENVADAINKRNILFENQIGESKDRTFNDSVLNAKVRGNLSTVAISDPTRRSFHNFPREPFSNIASSSSQKITNNPVYESELRYLRENRRIKEEFSNNVNNYDVVLDIDNEKTYHEVADVDSCLSKNDANNLKNNYNSSNEPKLELNKSNGGFFKAFKALVFNKKEKSKKNEVRKGSVKKSKANKKKKKLKSYDLCHEDGIENEIVDAKVEKKLTKEREKQAKKLEKENLKKLKANKKKKKKKDTKLDLNDDDTDSNCYKDPIQLEEQNKNFTLKNKVDTVHSAESMKRAQKKSRDKILFNWDKVVKKAVKDPNGLKNILQDQCDDYKRRKAAAGRLTPKSKTLENDIDDTGIPINQLLTGAGKQGELIRSLFSYLNQYGDDGFTIKQPGIKGGFEGNVRKQPFKGSKIEGKNGKNEKQEETIQTTVKNNQKSNVPYYLKCCLEVQPPGPGSTIGSRRLIVEEGILNESEGTCETLLNKNKADGSNHKQSETEKLKQALHKLSTRINSNSDVKLDEKVLDRFIEELDGDGKAEVLKRKLSMYLKMKKSSSQSNLSYNSDSYRSENKSGTHDIQPITTTLDDTQHNPTTNKADIPSRIDTIKTMDKNNAESGIPILLRQAMKKESEKLLESPKHLTEKVDTQVEIDFTQKIETLRKLSMNKGKPPLSISSSLTRIQPALATQAAKDSDLEMFYFSSEMPNNKTLFKTRKIFRGICKHLHLDLNNQDETTPKATRPSSSLTKINPETSDTSHHYQHQNIFKTLLKSKSQQRQRKVSDSEPKVSYPELIQVYRPLEDNNRQPGVHASEKRQQIPDKPPIPPVPPPPPERPPQPSNKTSSNKQSKIAKQIEDNNKKDKTNKTRLEKLINELSTPEAIHALRNRYETNEEIINKAKDMRKALLVAPNIKSKEKFHGHMKELVHVLNEKFGTVNTSGSTMRTSTQQQKKKTISSKNKAHNTFSSSRYNGKRKNSTITGKKKSSMKKKRRSTRIGWRFVNSETKLK